MKKMMLINASHEEESRVALVVDNHLQELDIESSQKALTKGNIYKATITKVEPSLQAAFVEYGAARQGFLPLSEIHPDYWKEGADKSADPRKISIQDVVEARQTLLVQVVKEERGNKGAAVTTQLSLAGRYLVLMPNTARGGISRKLSESERKAIKEIIEQLHVPDNMGVIVRTAGRDQPLEALQWDFQYLRRIWDEIRIKGNSAPSPSLIYLEGDIATRAIRDHFTDDIDEIWVDDAELYQRTKNFVHAVLPGKEKLVKHYRQKVSMFRHFNIESQCEDIHEREVRLPSGGSIVFDPTEALTAVDINSSRATGGKHIDETALETNLEAAAEIARQLRIRDIGGLIVIDFIDMANRKHAQQVEAVLRDAVKEDKARVQLARISRFGLLEMSRQRLHPSVRESTTEVCPRCRGKGTVRTVESMALQMLTRMEDWAEAGKKPTLVVQVPSDTGEYLMNRKRDNIASIEESYGVQITLQIRPDLDIPHYRIERQWLDGAQQRTELLEDTAKNRRPIRPGKKLRPMKPVVGIPRIQHPKVKETPKQQEAEQRKGLLNRLLSLIFGGGASTDEAKQAAPETSPPAPEPEAVIKEQRPRKRRRKPSSRHRTGEENKSQPKDEKKSPDEQGKAAAADNGNNEGGNTEKKRKRPPRRKPRKRKPEGDQQESQQQANNDDAVKAPTTAEAQQMPQQNADNAMTAKEQGSEQPGGEPQRRRRRRRRRRRPDGANSSGDASSASHHDEQPAASQKGQGDVQSNKSSTQASATAREE